MIMKKVVAWILVLAMTAAISVGVTLAFMQDTDEDVNVMTMGNVKIDQLEFERTDVDDKDEDAKVQEFHNDKPLYPAVLDDDFDWNKQESYVKWDDIGKTGYRSDIWNPDKINNELDKMVFVKNKGDYGAYVRSVFAFEVNGYSYDEFKANFHLNLNTIDWTWTWSKHRSRLVRRTTSLQSQPITGNCCLERLLRSVLSRSPWIQRQTMQMSKDLAILIRCWSSLRQFSPMASLIPVLH